MCSKRQIENGTEVCRKEDCRQLKCEFESLREEKMELEEKYRAVVSELHYLKTSASVVMSIKHNDGKTKFYTRIFHKQFEFQNASGGRNRAQNSPCCLSKTLSTSQMHN